MEELLSPTKARNNFFKLLDEVIATHQPKFINRGGIKIKIALEEEKPKSIFDKITPCDDLIINDSEDLANFKAWEFDSNKYNDL